MSSGVALKLLLLGHEPEWVVLRPVVGDGLDPLPPFLQPRPHAALDLLDAALTGGVGIFDNIVRFYLDGAGGEVAKFPDKDIVVDDSFNGEHQGGPADFFLPLVMEPYHKSRCMQTDSKAIHNLTPTRSTS